MPADRSDPRTPAASAPAAGRGQGGRVAAAIVGALGLAVLLAGPLHHALDALFHRDPEFAKVFRYLALGLLVVGLALVLRPWRDVPPDGWGLRSDPARRTLRFVASGVVVTAVVLVGLAALHFAAGVATWDRTGDAWPKFWHRVVKFGVPALLFAFVEEAFFRGWLVDRFWRARRSPLVAAVVASSVFGFIHAFRAQYAPGSGGATPVEPGPAGALEILRSWGEHALDVSAFGPRFLALSLFAFVLCAARRRFGTIALGIGAHAAVYAGLQLYSALTEPAGAHAAAGAAPAVSADARTWLGSKWLYDGVPGIVLLALAASLLWPRHRSSSEPAGIASPSGGSAVASARGPDSA